MIGVEYILGGLVVVVVLGFVALPLLRSRPATDDEVSISLDEERAEIYRELLELELDRKVGKVTEADFRELSDALLARAAALIAADEGEWASNDDAIELEIAAMRESLRSARSEAAEPAAAREARS
jgi:hypothetical protein